MTEKQKIEVSLLGHRFYVRTEENENYVQKLADRVAKNVETVRKQARAISTHHLTLLASLTLADEYFKKEKEITELQNTFSQKLQTFETLRIELQRKDEAVQQAEKERIEQKYDREKLHEALSVRANKVMELESVLLEQKTVQLESDNEEIAKLKATIGEKNAEIAILTLENNNNQTAKERFDQKIDEKTTALDQIKEALGEKIAIIESMENRISRKDIEIEEVRQGQLSQSRMLQSFRDKIQHKATNALICISEALEGLDCGDKSEA